jgi:hypothetical protein
MELGQDCVHLCALVLVMNLSVSLQEYALWLTEFQFLSLIENKLLEKFIHRNLWGQLLESNCCDEHG